jgi:hypothetical protein
MEIDDLPSIPPFPLQIGDSNQYISGIVVLPLSILVEITVKDVTSGQTWTCGPLPAPPPLEAFGNALNAWRASITYPTDPEPPTQTLDAHTLRPYCWRYRHAYEHAGLDAETLKRFRLQLYREWETNKKHQDVFPFRSADRGSAAQRARKAERRNFNDALDTYLEKWKQNRSASPYQD